MGIVGWYGMCLYCDKRPCKVEKCITVDSKDVFVEDGYSITFHEFTGANESECLKKARSVGWIFHYQKNLFLNPVQKVSCPYCSGKKTVRIKKYKEIL